MLTVCVESGEAADKGFNLIAVYDKPQGRNFHRVESGDALMADVGPLAEGSCRSVRTDTFQMPGQNPLTFSDFLLNDNPVHHSGCLEVQL